MRLVGSYLARRGCAWHARSWDEVVDLSPNLVGDVGEARRSGPHRAVVTPHYRPWWAGSCPVHVGRTAEDAGTSDGACCGF
jgi:hypothetical protein